VVAPFALQGPLLAPVQLALFARDDPWFTRVPGTLIAETLWARGLFGAISSGETALLGGDLLSMEGPAFFFSEHNLAVLQLRFPSPMRFAQGLEGVGEREGSPLPTPEQQVTAPRGG